MLNKLFGFDPSTMTLRKEVLGGITTFLTMAYILAVNPNILSATGMDQGALFTSTIVSAVIATLVMAIYAKLPIGLAPGMGLNAFFAYTVVLTMGYSWQFALTAVFIEGLIFILLTLSGLCQRIVEVMPLVLRNSISPAIGLFLAFIGLQNAGLIVKNDATLITLGNLHDPSVLLAVFGILLSSVLVVLRINGALLIGILATAVAGIPLGTTHFSEIISTPPSLTPILCQFEWSHIFSLDMLVCVFTFLFLDMFDTIGSLIGVATRAGMVDEKGNIKQIDQAFMADAVGTTLGAVLGTSTVTTFVESAAGVEVGGRSGLTAFTTSICFLLALFLAPLFLSIPAQATAPALILTGVMMMNNIQRIDFTNYIDAIPCFVCILLMPLSYSISDGILLGTILYVLIRLFCGRWRELNIGLVALAILFILKYIFLF